MAHEEIYRELAECLETGEFVAYHKWGGEPGSFLVGSVQSLTATSVVFWDVDTHGEIESLPYAVPLRLIHSLDRRTHYLWRLRTLYDLGTSDPEDARDVRKAAEVRALLEEAAKERGIVRVWTSADEANDYLVSSVGDEVAALESVTDGGQAGRSLDDSVEAHREGAGRAGGKGQHSCPPPLGTGRIPVFARRCFAWAVDGVGTVTNGDILKLSRRHEGIRRYKAVVY